MMNKKTKEIVIIVAHPDDEVLWAGGTLLNHPEWNCFIISMCRKHDCDRAPKFYKILNAIKADGVMGNLDDGPAQRPLDQKEIQELILELVPPKKYDCIISHSPSGEYTRHLRHEEIGAAVITLWSNDRLQGDELWIFAFEDGQRQYLPKAVKTADLYFELPVALWKRKYELITGIYGFGADSWEARAIPKNEAFWRFTKKKEAYRPLPEKQTA